MAKSVFGWPNNSGNDAGLGAIFCYRILGSILLSGDRCRQ